MVEDELKEAMATVWNSLDSNEVSVKEFEEQLVEETGVDQKSAHVAMLANCERSYKNNETFVTGLHDSILSDEMKTDDAVQERGSIDSDDSDDEDTVESGDPVDPDEWESRVLEAEKFDVESPRRTDETFNHVPVREDEGHPLVPPTRNYVNQAKSSGVSVVEDFGFKVADNDFGVRLIGEPGTGKGEMVKYVASKANIPLIRVNFGQSVTKERLVGRYVPKNNGEGLDEVLERAREMAENNDGVTVGSALETLGERDKFSKSYGLLSLAVKNGWWFLADELNAADPESLFPFFGLLEDEGSRTLEITEFAERIEPHPGFRFIGTMNPAHHRGTNRLNDAFLDRLYDIEKDYLPAQKEIDLVKSQTRLDRRESKKVVELANSIRNSYPEEYDRTLTMRGLFRIARLSEIYPLETAAKQELLEGLDDSYTEQKNALKKKIENVF